MTAWLEPTEENAALTERRIRRDEPWMRLLLRPLVKVHVRGQEHIPRQGAALILANHANATDPFILGSHTGRCVHQLYTSSLASAPVLGRFLHDWGMVPKPRFVRGSGAGRLLQRWAALGQVVGFFPEGERSWMGELRPFVSGLAPLVRRLDIPVILARLDNQFLLGPRWGVPRFGHAGLTFSAPRRFDPDATDDEIIAWVRSGLVTPPRGDLSLPIRGVRLTRGLTNLVFRCPSCGVLEQVVERGSRLRCEACRSRWTMDARGRLHGVGGAEDLQTVVAALRARTIAEWTARAGSDAPVYTAGDVTLTLRDGAQTRRLGPGRLVLRPDSLALEQDGAPLWSTPLSAIEDTNVEWQRALELRTADLKVKGLVPTGSAWKWPWAIRWWRDRG